MNAFAPNPIVAEGPPAWAETWGEDVYGVWAGFVIGEVEHRLRWIPGGHFTMGSPEGERGRLDEKEAQRDQTVDGFWLGETPVTQALWTAVMGDNPSRFASKRLPWRCLIRPVEQVSWDEVQVFLQKINTTIDGLDLRLPTEAQWEYACRAGTTTATYAGDLDDEDFASEVLSPVAWYGGNAAQEFDLEDGEDLETFWKQYDQVAPPGRSGTHPVGRKAPNPWGLYDMLGNVYEWCQDEYKRGRRRVIRGGSWDVYAGNCRAACRGGRVPGGRVDDVGFRVSRGQTSGRSP